MKNCLPLALTVLMLGSSIPAMAADVSADVATKLNTPAANADIKLNSELSQDKTQAHADSKAEISEGDTALGQSDQPEIKTDSEAQAEEEAAPAASAGAATNDALPSASATTETKTDIQTEASNGSSNKNVQKLFSMFHKDNAPQAEANAKTNPATGSKPGIHTK